MMISNCSGCGKLQLRTNQMLCDACLKRHIEDSQRVRQFLSDNPKVTVVDLVMQTGFTIKRVNELVKR
jgi:predicted amidophosphoribosyltransferase